MLHKTKKSRGLLFLAGLYAIIAVAIVIPILYYLNNSYLVYNKIDDKTNTGIYYNAASTPGAENTAETHKITDIPVNATDVSFSYDNKYCIYLYDGTMYIKEIDTNKTIRKIKERSKIEKAVLMDDRNIIIYITIGKKLFQSIDYISVNSYDIEKNTRIAEKTFNVGLNAKIKQVDYSSLTNLIFVNVETNVNNTISDRVYYLDINKKVRTLSTERIVDNMVLLGGAFDLYYQDNKNTLFCNSKKVRGFETQKVILLGRDPNDNIYVRLLAKKDTIYVINDSKRIKTIHLSNTGYIKFKYCRTGIYAVYDHFIIDLSDNTGRKITYNNSYSFISLVNDRVYLKDKNNAIISYKVK